MPPECDDRSIGKPLDCSQRWSQFNSVFNGELVGKISYTPSSNSIIRWRMEDRFAGIREFVATIDGGSFTAAAVELGVTGSAVGKSIPKLEARLGAQLLHRTTRRIDLTTEGEASIKHCSNLSAIGLSVICCSWRVTTSVSKLKLSSDTSRILATGGLDRRTKTSRRASSSCSANGLTM